MEALIFIADHVVDEGKFIDYGEKSVILNEGDFCISDFLVGCSNGKKCSYWHTEL